jgi:putative ABC transport system substrate-binding protein
MNRREVLSLLSAAALSPLAARAQEADRLPRIGTLLANSAEREKQIFGDDPFGLRDLGYVEEKNILIERRFADGHVDRLPSLAAELVALNVDVIIAGGEAAYAAHDATKTIPIVATGSGELVKEGLVSSLAHPGGNVTGVTFSSPEYYGKRLELLKQVVPSLRRAGVLGLRGQWGAHDFDVMGPYAKAQAIELEQIEVAGKDYAAAFEAARSVDGLVSIDRGQLFGDAALICSLAVERRLPFAGHSFFATQGALIGYGARVQDLFRHAGVLVDKILKGAKPGDIPVEIASRFETSINLKTARALKLDVPPAVLAAADEVIE